MVHPVIAGPGGGDPIILAFVLLSIALIALAWLLGKVVPQAWQDKFNAWVNARVVQYYEWRKRRRKKREAK